MPRGVLKCATRRSARASQPALEVSVFAFARVLTTQNRGIARIRTLRGSAGGRVKRQRSGEVPLRVLNLAIGDERFPQRVRHFRTQHRSKPQNGSSSTRSVPARSECQNVAKKQKRVSSAESRRRRDAPFAHLTEALFFVRSGNARF